MGFNVEKGNKFEVDKGIQNIIIGVGWKEGRSTKPIDIDVHALGCSIVNGAPKFYNDNSHVVSYANKGALNVGSGSSFGTKDGSITHTGDNLTGVGEGDDESIKVNLAKVPDGIDQILILITIHQAKERGQNFGMVDDSYVRIVNEDNADELCRYDLRQEFATAITIQAAALVKTDGKWAFVAIGGGTKDETLMDVLNKLS